MYYPLKAVLSISNISTVAVDNLWLYQSLIALLLLLSIYLFFRYRSLRKNTSFSSNKTSPASPLVNSSSFSVNQYSEEESDKILAERNLLFSLINGMPDRIYFKDQKSRFILANLQMAKIMKLEKPEDLIGKTDFDFHSKERANVFFKDEQDIIKGKVKIINKEEKSINEAGEEITISTTKVPMLDQKGTVIGIMGIGRDITNLKVEENKNVEANEALQEVNALLEERQEEIDLQSEELKNQTNRIIEERNQILALINSMPDRIYIKDRESRFILGNIHVAKIMGTENPENLIGKTDYDFYPKEFAEPYFNDEQDLMKKDIKIINKEEKGYDEAQKEIFVSTTKVPIKDPDGNVIGIVGIGRDITNQKEIEKQLKKTSEDLKETNVLLEERQEEIYQQAEELKVQTEMLIKDKNQILTLINSMPDHIYIKDRKSRFILGNIHVAKTSGSSGTEGLIGKTDYDFYPKEFADDYFRDEQELMEKDIQIINKEEKGYNEAKEEIVISTSKVPLKDQDGTVIGIVGIGRDITTQKEIEKQLKKTSEDLKETNVLLEERQEEIYQQAEELKTQTESLLEANFELEKLSLVASKTDSSIIITDADGNFEWVNEGFIKRYGMNLDEFVSSRGRNLRNNSSSKEILDVFEKIKESKVPGSYVTQTTDVKDKIFWSQTSITPILDHNEDIASMIIIDMDISTVKEAEEQIAIQNDKLKTLNATKDKFFSIIAHDLKNPFHSIMGFSELLFRNFSSIEDDKKVEFIKLINESSTSAYGLLENLLNWARTQTNKISFDPTMIDLRVMFSEIYQMHSVNAKNKGINLILPEGQEEIKVFADYNMINTILRNLSSNSLKYSEAGGEISISYKQENDRVKISVSDTGLGMTQEVMDRLFRIDEFHTQKGTSGETGTGLGLIICQEFALRHNSEIEVESELGKGSSFSFSLDTKAP